MKKTTTAQTQEETMQQATGAYVPPMDVAVRINSIKPEGSLRARLSMNLGGVFAVRGIKLMEGKNGPFLSMPSYKMGDSYKDHCFSFDEKFTQHLLNTAVQEYNQVLEQTHMASQSHQDQPQQSGQQQAAAPYEAPGYETGQQMASM